MSLASSRILVLVLPALLAACEWRVVDDSHSSNNADPYGQNGTSNVGGACGRAGEQTCSTTTTTTTTTPPSASDCGVKIDRWKELMIIHQSVLLDRRAQNDATDPIWSFRARLEELAGAKSAAPALAQAWLDQWRTVTVVGADRAPVTPRPNVTSVLIDPWRSQSAGGSELSLANAPFRLIAIVNRPDLRQELSACNGGGGELRFVYSAVDPVVKKAIPMTVIVEIPYPSTRTARGWIDAWHALAQKPFGAEYNDALAAITSEVTQSSKPETWRVRTNEIALATTTTTGSSTPKQGWELREFGLMSDAQAAYTSRQLVQMPLGSTPRIDLNASSSLDTWAEENRTSILDGSYVLPGGFQAGAAPVSSASFQWSSQKMPYEVRKAFGMATCNGCHGGERIAETALPFQHIAAPDQKTQYYGTANDGETRLSSWLNNPFGSADDDELGRREKSMATVLCQASSACASPYSKNSQR